MKHLNLSPTLAPIGWIIAALALILFVGAPRSAATAPDVRADLKLALAKVAVNEAGFSSLPDVALIYAAAGSMGRSHQTRLNWLRRHSRRVLGDRECLRGNCRWTRSLEWNDMMPVGWDPVRDGRWVPQRWARARRWAHGIVEGTLEVQACPGDEPPQTWGGRMDHARALRHGLSPLGCREFSHSLNEGYRYLTGEERASATETAEMQAEVDELELVPTNDSAIPATVAQGEGRRE